MGSTKERARSVVGLLTSLGLAMPGAAVAGCIGTTNPPPTPMDGGVDARELPDVPVAPDVPLFDTPIGTENPVPDTGPDAPLDDAPLDDAPLDDAPLDDDAAADDDAGTAG